jgi:hypothetical protein
VLHERSFPLKLGLSPDSWGKAEAALVSQNSLGRCGMVLHPEKAMRGLRELVAEGIEVRLPRSILRPVRLPARLEQTVTVNDSIVRLSLTGGRFHSRKTMPWSSTRVSVASAPSRATP